jgi:hypothetical protein
VGVVRFRLLASVSAFLLAATLAVLSGVGFGGPTAAAPSGAQRPYPDRTIAHNGSVLAAGMRADTDGTAIGLGKP